MFPTISTPFLWCGLSFFICWCQLDRSGTNYFNLIFVRQENCKKTGGKCERREGQLGWSILAVRVMTATAQQPARRRRRRRRRWWTRRQWRTRNKMKSATPPPPPLLLILRVIIISVEIVLLSNYFAKEANNPSQDWTSTTTTDTKLSRQVSWGKLFLTGT